MVVPFQLRILRGNNIQMAILALYLKISSDSFSISPFLLNLFPFMCSPYPAPSYSQII